MSNCLAHLLELRVAPATDRRNSRSSSSPSSSPTRKPTRARVQPRACSRRPVSARYCGGSGRYWISVAGTTASAALTWSTEPLSPGLSTRTETLTFAGAACSTAGGGASGGGASGRGVSGAGAVMGSDTGSGGGAATAPAEAGFAAVSWAGTRRKRHGRRGHGLELRQPHVFQAGLLECRDRGRQIGNSGDKPRIAALRQRRGARRGGKPEHRERDSRSTGRCSRA